MFISNHEKEYMRISIRTLQAEMSALIKEVKALQNAQKPKKALSPIIFRTEEAPWGYKLDGTPRKQSGRPAHRKLEVAS